MTNVNSIIIGKAIFALLVNLPSAFWRYGKNKLKICNIYKRNRFFNILTTIVKYCILYMVKKACNTI